MKKALLLAGLLSSFVLNLHATVVVSGGTGGIGISADKAANSISPGWTNLTAIQIAETTGTGKGDFTNGTIVLKAPTGFEFNTNQRPSVTFNTGNDLSGASFVSMDSTTLTVSLTSGGTTKFDTFFIGVTTNLQVRPTSGFLLTNGIIYRPSGISGGTLTLPGFTSSTNANGSGGTPFASLSVVAGNATKLVFTRDPASANVGAIFGTQPIIRAQDQFSNNTAAGLAATATVTIALNAGTGPLLGTISTNIGTAGGNGVITNTNLRIDSVGVDKKLSASATNLTTGLSGVFSVNQGNQAITFPAIADHVYGDASFSLGATSSSGLTVSYAVLSGSATVTNNIVTITGAGPVSIEASQVGDLNWTAAPPVTNTFAVAKANPTITWNNPGDITYGTALDTTNHLNATSPVPGGFAYSPTTGTILNAGSNQVLSVTFTPTDSANYSNAVTTVFINVAKANQSITFNALSDKLTTDLPFTLNATASSGLDVLYNIVIGPASVSSNVVTLSGATGSVTVSASQPGDGNYNSASNVEQSFNVNNGTPTITWNTPADLSYGIPLSTNQLNATANVPGTFAYDPSVGALLPLGTNQVLSVVFTPNDTNSYSIMSTNVLINVVKATPSITWTNPAAITFGAILTTNELNAVASVPGVLTYTPDVGTALNAGTNQVLSVSFVPDDSTNYNNASASVSINVLKATPLISWSTSSSIVYGTALSAAQLNASNTVAGTFSYSPTYGTVLNAGTQTLNVSFVPDDSANYEATSTNVSLSVLKASTTITWSNPADITYGTTLGLAQLNATPSVPGNLVYNPASGALLNAGTNQLSVTFTPTDSANYDGTNAAVSIVVNKATSVITWNTPADITYGTALSVAQLNAGASIAGTFTYTPTNGTVLTSGNAQLLSVDFVPNDSTNYNNASTNVLINVLKATPTITWSNPASIVYGTLLSTNQLNATATVAGVLTYTPDVGVLLNAGANQALSVSFVPDDTANYNSTSTNALITVLKVTPTISWSNPGDISFGTLLSGAQLNAIPSVPGALTYSPTNGTILNAGNNQSLSVTLTPTDSTNYNITVTNVVINVSKAPVTLTWNNPADINYGTALSATQLNATSSIAGTFVYSPAAAVVLPAGNSQTLSANFTPTSANYSNATATANINVLKVPLTVKANDVTRFVGQANPTFTATYTGFTNGDTSSSLLTPPTFSTLADTNSAIGFYDIFASGATSGNYDISFAKGTLTVSPASTITSTVGGGNWSVTNTWIGGVVPGAGDNVVIVAGSTVTVDIAASAFSVTLSNSATAAAALNVSATKSLVVGGGAGLVSVGQTQTVPTANSSCVVDVAGTLQSGNIDLIARRNGSRSADAILRISNASALVTVANNISEDRNSTVGSLLSQVNFTAAGLLKVGGGLVFVGTGGGTPLVPGVGTIEYNANGNQAIAALTYNNLTLSGSGTKTGSAVTIGATGTLLLKDSAIYAGTTPTYTAGSTLFYARTGAQVTGSALPLTSPANWSLSVSNASGITLRQSATVTGTLRLLAGNITTTPTNTLTADGTVIRTSGYIIGNLRKNFPIGSNVSQTFEVGLTSSYAPVSLTFSNVSTAGHVTIVANPSKHIAIGSSILDASKGVNLNWTATQGPSLVADAYNAVFNFASAELDGAASSALLVVGNYSAGSWTYPTVAARTANSVQVNGLTSFSDFQLAESGNRINPTITWSNPSDIVYGAVLTTNELNATANTPGNFVYTPALGASLSAGSAQTLSVTFTPNDLATYAAITTNVTINVLKATPLVSWNNPADIIYGAVLSTNELNATANVPGSFLYAPDFGQQLNAGTNALSAVFIPADSTNYNNVPAFASIVVLKATPTVTWNTPAAISYGTLLDTNQLNASSLVAGAFNYNPATGALLGVGTNTLNVAFVPTDSANYNNASNSVALIVTKAVPSIVWTNPADIFYNTPLDTNQLNAATVVPGTFVYAPDFGFVLAAGTNQTLSATFTPTDTNSYEIISTNVVINVLKANPSLTWATPASIVYGTALTTNQLNASSDVSGTLSYTPAAGEVLNAGTNILSVSFVPTDTANYNNVSTTVNLVVTKANASLTWATPASITYGAPLTSNQLNASSDVAGVLTYTPAAGEVLNAGTNILSVSFVPTDTANYNNASTTVNLVVTKANASLTWATPASITYGTALTTNQLNASSDVAGALTYTPAAGEVLNAGTNILSVSFVPTDTANYNNASTTVNLVVTKANASLTWATPASIAYGTALTTNQLNASSDVPGALTYTPAAGEVLNAGTNILSVSFVPTDTTNYNNASTTVSIVVTKGNSLLTWATPTSITYGAALTTNELNATAAVAGTFTYTPDVGASLSSGTNTLNVSFVPNDSTNYGNASTSVALVVTKANLSVTANNSAREYGLTNPALSGIISGIQNGDNISASYVSSAAVGSGIGSYAIVPSLIDPDGKLTNYVSVSTNGTLTVTTAPLSVTAADKTKVYGTANPTFNGTLIGIRNSDNITASYSSVAGNLSGVGNYPITIVLNDPSTRLTNYLVSSTNGVLTVVKDSPQVVLLSAINPAAIGATVEFTATVSTTNIAVTNGLVQFDIDATNTIIVPVRTNGVAHLIFNFGSVGSHAVQSTYLGDSNRNSDSDGLSQSVVALPLEVLAVIMNSDGSASIRFVGDGSSSYHVEASSDFNSWTTIGTAVPGIDGLLEVVDGAAASHPLRFYRTVKD